MVCGSSGDYLRFRLLSSTEHRMPLTRSATARSGLVLGVLVLVQLLFGIDSSVVNIALPTIGADLHLDIVGQAWVQTAYVLAFGALLLLGGRLGAAAGRRRMVVVGVAVFAVASLLGGLAPTGAVLIGARALQG